MNELQGVWSNHDNTVSVICYDWTWTGNGVVRVHIQMQKGEPEGVNIFYQKFPRSARELHVTKVLRGRRLGGEGIKLILVGNVARRLKDGSSMNVTV